MATVRLMKNILDGKVETFSVNGGNTLEELIRKHTDGKSYEGVMVECYDPDTDTTYYASVEDDDSVTNAIVSVNGKTQFLNYTLSENDVVEVIITPAGGAKSFIQEHTQGVMWAAGAFAGALSGAMAGFLIGCAFPPAGPIVGLVVGAALGATLGMAAGGLAYDEMHRKHSSSEGLNSNGLPDVRGSQNQPLTDQAYPFVLGKHLAVPFIIGSPWNEITGSRGQENRIHCLYAVGYAPLRITDLKLGDMYLAHNQPWSGNKNLKNIFHGRLHGTSESTGSGSDDGDIVSTWANNDITVEILQQGQNGQAVDYGSVYPYAKVQEEVKANVLYIADGDLVNLDKEKTVTYKGLGLKNGLRNCHVHFSEQYPKSVKVELDFNSGLYKTRSETDDDESNVYYRRIPVWAAIQWRVYSADNAPADGESSGTDIPIPTFDYEKGAYEEVSITKNGKAVKGHFRGWHSFSTMNGGTLSAHPYTAEARHNDISAHSGNHGLKENDLNNGWLNAQAFNFEPLGGTNDDEEGLNEIRCVTEVDLVEWARQNLLTAAERNSSDSEAILAKKYNAYFFDGTNTSKSVEIRVVRISPNYIDESKSTDKHSAYTFNDSFVWTYLTSEMIDGDLLKKRSIISQKRPLEEARMRKLCVISLSAKTDNVDQLSNTIRKFSVVAQSFAPYYDKEQHKWLPTAVTPVTKYYDEPYKDESGNWKPGTEITKERFYELRQAGKKAESAPAGNDFVKNLVEDVIRISSNLDDKGRYFLPEESPALSYCTNNVASMFLLAGIGPHLGNDALGYEQKFYDENHELKDNSGDFSMTALAKWYLWAEDVEDGSTYSSAGFHFDKDGKQVWHEAKEPVHIYFAANAYIYSEEKLESLLAKIAVAGRSVITRDRKNRLTVVTDKPEKYPVALINQQNTLKSSYSISFEPLPSGLQIAFSDENDGYNQNNLYCMVDGEDSYHPRGAIESYKTDFVTNNIQQWSLGRYILANRILNREIVTKQLGLEGASIGLGDVVLVQDDTMLIGTDNGGRITRLIENDFSIFGFVVNSTYKFTGETEEYEKSDGTVSERCKQGVIVMQPAQYGSSRVVTLRLAEAGRKISVDGETFENIKGDTNLVLLDTPVAKGEFLQDSGDYYAFRPKEGYMVGFGIVGQITAKYRVIKIKPDAKRTYEFTLCQYNEKLYNYGAELPSFQNNMTVPDRSGEDAFALSDNVKTSDLAKILTDSATLAQGKIDKTFGNEIPVPTNLVAAVQQDCIQVRCEVPISGVNNVDHIVYEVTKYRKRDETLETALSTIEGSYSTEYYFNRSWEGFPEKLQSGTRDTESNNGELDFWKVRAKAVGIYLDSEGNRLESGWTDYVYMSADSLLEYGTWIPPVPAGISFKASENGITAIWACDTTKVYGSVQFEVSTFYENTLRNTQVILTKAATYQFDRSVDGYPEKPGTLGMKLGTLTLDKFNVRVKAVNITSGKTSQSALTNCDYSEYKTWIPVAPEISTRVSNRNVTLYLSSGSTCYGIVNYLVGVRRYDDPENIFYVPDVETNPYARESAYKLVENGIFKLGHRESESQYSQTMPLETQNGTQGLLDHDETEEDNRVLATNDNKAVVMSLGGFAPVDTAYQFEVYAFNKTVEVFYDAAGGIHNYSVATYHKVSRAASRKMAVALATSVQDVLNGSIISDKVGDGAIKETKIEDNAISTPKLQANAVIGEKIYSYNNISLAEGTHVISGFAPSPETDEEFFRYTETIKKNRSDTLTIDNYIKAHSKSFWMGLDTDMPEFYMGSDFVEVANDKATYPERYEAMSFFHFYTNTVTVNGVKRSETNLDLKLSNFIVTAVSSTVKGFFNVRNKFPDTEIFDDSNSFLQVNPQMTQDAVYGTPAETLILKGDLIIDRKNSNGGRDCGQLTVRGNSSLGTLNVSGDSVFDGAIITDSIVGRDGQLSITGSLTVSKDFTANGDTVLKNLHVTGITIGILPIGACYIQFPYTKKPSELFGGVWQKLTELFQGIAGSFFRLNGGMASIFETGVQPQSIQKHKHGAGEHTHDYSGTTTFDGEHQHEYWSNGFTNIGDGPPLAASTISGRTEKGGKHKHEYSGTTTKGSGYTDEEGSNETRPINITVIVWQRIS